MLMLSSNQSDEMSAILVYNGIKAPFLCLLMADCAYNTNNTIMEKKPESKTPQEEVINTNKAPQNEMLLTTTVKVQGNKYYD